MTTETATNAPIVCAPLFPTYSELRSAMRAFDGEPVKQIRDTITAIFEQTGTPQNPVDWSEPDTWIEERLSGEPRAIARKVWDGSGKTLNPRYLNGCYLFINRLKLLDQDDGIYRIGERGRLFLANDEAILRELDKDEGLPKLLSLVAERSPCKRGDILPAWSDAETLEIPFVFSSNGDGFVFHDRTGGSTEKEADLGLDAFPSPANLWMRYAAWKGLTSEAEQLVLQDYFDDGSGKAPRYYQVNAVNAAIEAIAKGRDRILLVMATGTGKTYTAFQIIWRLWKAGRKKRIWYLADRNVLIDQTMQASVTLDGTGRR